MKHIVTEQLTIPPKNMKVALKWVLNGEASVCSLPIGRYISKSREVAWGHVIPVLGSNSK